MTKWNGHLVYLFRTGSDPKLSAIALGRSGWEVLGTGKHWTGRQGAHPDCAAGPARQHRAHQRPQTPVLRQRRCAPGGLGLFSRYECFFNQRWLEDVRRRKEWRDSSLFSVLGVSHSPNPNELVCFFLPCKVSSCDTYHFSVSIKAGGLPWEAGGACGPGLVRFEAFLWFVGRRHSVTHSAYALEGSILDLKTMGS